MINHLFILINFFVIIIILPAISQSQLDLQGHRGCRGLMPENTMPAFLIAVELGVTTIEMDVVISSDKQIVVSHEPWMSHVICSHPDGRPVKKAEAKSLNLYKMKYDQIQSFDCGLRLHPEFPQQRKVNAIKPTLKIVVRSVQRFATDNKYKPPLFNIEIKSKPRWYDMYTPKPPMFVELVVNEIRRLGIENQTTIQSFDIAVLEELHKVNNRQFQIAYLIGKGKNLQKTLAKLHFKPDIYSPNYKLLTPAMVKLAHEMGLRVIPWTVNNGEDLEKLIGWGVDGIITDYPDLR